MPQAIQPVQAAPVNPSQAVLVQARSLPSQPLASHSSLQSLSSSDKGCLRRTWDYFISILGSIYAYCCCRRNSNLLPVNSQAQVAIPSSNPVNQQALQPAAGVDQSSRVSDVENESDDDDDLGPMPTLRESNALVLELYNELIPDRLEELVSSDRWEEIQLAARRLGQRASHSAVNQLLKEQMEKLFPLLVAAKEWKRHLENENEEIAPFRGNIVRLRDPDILAILPELLSRARAELRESPEDIDIDFINHLTMRIGRMRGRAIENVREELENTLLSAKKIHEMHNAHFFEREEDLARCAPALEIINQLIEQFLPDHVEASINTPGWSERFEAQMNRLEAILPEGYQRDHFTCLYGDRNELLAFLIDLGQIWQEHLQNPSQVAPYRGGRSVDIRSLSNNQREELSQSLLSAAKEQARTPPAQIDLERLTILENIIERFESWAENGPERAVPNAIAKTKEAIQLAKGLKELHNEGVFQRA